MMRLGLSRNLRGNLSRQKPKAPNMWARRGLISVSAMVITYRYFLMISDQHHKSKCTTCSRWWESRSKIKSFRRRSKVRDDKVTWLLATARQLGPQAIKKEYWEPTQYTNTTTVAQQRHRTWSKCWKSKFTTAGSSDDSPMKVGLLQRVNFSQTNMLSFPWQLTQFQIWSGSVS